jgi:hypothetical protein
MPAEDLAATLAAGLIRPVDAEGSTRACPHEPPAWWADYDLLYETVATLEALLPSPQPASVIALSVQAAGFAVNVLAVGPGHRHDDGQKRGSPQGITDR